MTKIIFLILIPFICASCNIEKAENHSLDNPENTSVEQTSKKNMDMDSSTSAPQELNIAITAKLKNTAINVDEAQLLLDIVYDDVLSAFDYEKYYP